jgi:hypothetical protein
MVQLAISPKEGRHAISTFFSPCLRREGYQTIYHMAPESDLTTDLNAHCLLDVLKACSEDGVAMKN